MRCIQYNFLPLGCGGMDVDKFSSAEPASAPRARTRPEQNNYYGTLQRHLVMKLVRKQRL